MKTTIKIHEAEWFARTCSRSYRTNAFEYIKPKYAFWQPRRTVLWNRVMRRLEGKVLEVEHDCGNGAGSITDARYMAEGFYIPNWAIEWVKEEQERRTVNEKH